MSTLSLNLLGPFEACLNGKAIDDLRSRPVQALLVYLAVERSRAQRREGLFTLLWPRMPDKSARHNLRQTLYALRQAIPEVTDLESDRSVPLLLSDRQTVQLNPAAQVMVDVHQMDRLLGSTRVHDHESLVDCNTCIQALEKVVALYRGDFLADFYLEDSNEFEDWAQSNRQVYRRKVLETLDALATINMDRKDYDQARTYAQRQLEIDNLRESAYRQLMQVLARSDRRAEAIALYDTCRQLLAKELGMAPAARTTALYENIRTGVFGLESSEEYSVPGYELREKIGEGAYGVIYSAIQTAISREVAVKIINPQSANNPEFIRRFEAEAQTISRLEHPHIVPLYDFWRESGGAYLVMRMLRGGSLQDKLAQGPWTPERVNVFLGQIAPALDSAHRQGVVHRDIKPSNILFDENDNAFLADFGIAKDLTKSGHLTLEGGILGTPEYSSPEQLSEGPVSPQSDIYSLGAVLYEMLTGQRPFPNASLAKLIQSHLSEPFPLISNVNPNIQTQIDVVIQRATAKEPENRYADVIGMAESFRLAVQGQNPPVVASGQILDLSEVGNPYKGLRAFQEADAQDFFGREELVAQLVNRLVDSRFLAVIGPSGSGKSSAVKAGLIPALRQGALPGSENWFVAVMMPGEYPLEELELALWPVAVDPPPSLVAPMQMDPRGMLRTIRRILPGDKDAQLVLVIDQFEELFTLVDDRARRDFFLESLTTALTAARSPLRVIITLRADFYDRPLQHPILAHLFKAHNELVLPLTREELVQAILRPAEGSGTVVEDGVVEAVIADLKDQPGALPLMQYALTELFEARQDHTLTLQAYHEIGGVSGALSRRAETLFESLSKDEQAWAKHLFLRLVTLGEGVEDTRRRVPRAELVSLENTFSKLNPSEESEHAATAVETVLNRFGSYRLLTFDYDPASREPTVEVAHEALLREWPRLREWLDESRDDIRMQRLLAAATAEWQESSRDASFLLRGARLNQYSAWAASARVALADVEMAYLDASLEARAAREKAEAERQAREQTLEQRSRRVLRALVSVFAVSTVIALVLSIYAFNQRGIAQTEAQSRSTQQAVAESQARISVARELAAAAKNNLVQNPELSLLLALQAVATTRDVDGSVLSEPESALHQAVQASHVELSLPGRLEQGSAVFSPDGSQIASVVDGEVRLWDSLTGELQQTIGITEYPGTGATLVFSPDGARLAAAISVHQDPADLIVWDLESGEKLFKLVGEVAGADPPPMLAYSPDGNYIGVVNPDEEVLIIAVPSGRRVHTLVNDDWVNNLAFSPDGRKMATASGENNVYLWDLESETIERTLQGHTLQVFGVTFSPDGKQLATTGRDKRVIVWELESGQRVLSLSGMYGSDFLNITSFSPDGKRLATLDGNGQIQMWDLERSVELYRFSCVPGGAELDFNHDFSRVVATGAVGSIKVCRVGPDLEAFGLAGPASGEEVWHAAFDDSGKRLAVGAANSVSVWDLPAHIPLGAVLERPSLTLASKTAIDLSPDGTLVAADNYWFDGILWDAESGEKLFDLVMQDGVVTYDFSPDGERLAASTWYGRLLVFDPNNGEVLWDVPAHKEWVPAARFSPDGKWIATTAFGADPVKIWDAESGELLHSLSYEISKYDVGFSPDGSRLAAGTWEGHLLIWDTQSWELLSDQPGDSSPIFRLDYSVDGGRIFTSTYDGKVSAWDSASGQRLFTMADYRGGMWFVVASPDGRYLAATNADGFTRFFLLDMDELIALAQTRVTRGFTDEECQQYLHMQKCP